MANVQETQKTSADIQIKALQDKLREYINWATTTAITAPLVPEELLVEDVDPYDFANVDSDNEK
ncbi:hypothetical protein DFA_09717 [Cavenderia fasciculata]|uniref:Uncharacterized protein n=1 Tax=Cavenderia fasciculata TaxID=261658 RepID=F4Q8E5_CACFS|nr:uncharacterized protein DFA_09717 [Cavenderia fasciculata]EGG16045.1 hypothetical protein DFA_09717 [Cavenderia fasciculata]|eukprot:XP_004352370.1 hypothetical protein DFA_09717 [Cavenderia fasciculata]